ncbi:phage portal protein [Neisseria weixii]|uniref:phage portal protein n=1 Tax=Neisseria weixii TaxID=1853276 RepID=UPI00359F9B69
MGLFDKFFRKKSLQGVQSSGWRSIINEPFTGAWQRNQELKREDMAAFFAVFSCVTRISHDIAKLPLQTRVKKDDVWINQSVRGFDFLKKPNHYQSTQQFLESWLSAKLLTGNAYIFISRNAKGEIDGLYVLNSDRVYPLVDDDGEVFYQISNDRLNKIGEQVVTVPASEIIHDRWNCFYHPLVGLPPVMACNAAAGNGLAIQKSSKSFFVNRSMPAGILTAPGHIDKEKATALRDRWNEAYSGENAGKTAVLGDGMTYQSVSMTAVDSQLIEQLKLSAEIVCSTFKVPPFLIGFGSLPSGMKVSDLNELYYSSCLQALIESIENLLTYHSGAEAKSISIEFDLDSLIRMDGESQMTILRDGIGAGVFKINEARAKVGLGKVEGGDTPYLQQQNYSLQALAKRDAREDPFSNKGASNDSQP